MPSTSYFDSPTKQEIIEPCIEDEDFIQDVTPAIKRSHKSVSLADKLEIINLNEKGLRYSKISKLKQLSESTIRAICKRKEKFKGQAASSNSQIAKNIFIIRTRTMEHMEKYLLSWIFDLIKKGGTLGYSKVQEKAKFLYYKIKDNLEDKTDDA